MEVEVEVRDSKGFLQLGVTYALRSASNHRGQSKVPAWVSMPKAIGYEHSHRKVLNAQPHLSCAQAYRHQTLIAGSPGVLSCNNT